MRYCSSLVLVAMGFVGLNGCDTKTNPMSIISSNNVEETIQSKTDHGDTQTQSYLGAKYDIGEILYLGQDEKEAFAYYRTAAEKGDVAAQLKLAQMYSEATIIKVNGAMKPQVEKEAIRWYRKAAEQGHVDAQSILGGMYGNGMMGLPHDYKEAARWYRKAAEQGDVGAQSFLGLLYEVGEGVPQDFKEAVFWYRKAAEQGDAGAQYKLGVVYGKGKGIPQDFIQCYMWSNLAASNGDEKARSLRDSLVKTLTPSQIEAGQRLTREWLAAHPQKP